MFNIGHRIADLVGQAPEEFGEQFLATHNARVQEYARYDELAGVSNSVISCFASHVAQHFDGDGSFRLRTPLYFAAATAFTVALPKIQAEQLLKTV